MALLDENSLKRVIKNNKVHKKVISEYSIFEDCEGNKFLQLDTFGTQDRMFKDKISQSIQIDKYVAQKLIDILKREFLLK